MNKKTRDALTGITECIESIFDSEDTVETTEYIDCLEEILHTLRKILEKEDMSRVVDTLARARHLVRPSTRKKTVG